MNHKKLQQIPSTNKTVIFIDGKPGSGKSWLAEKLLSDYAFSVLSVDACYTEFVESQIPMLFMPVLKKYIRAHYDEILSKSGYARQKFGRDFVIEWREFLLERISAKLSYISVKYLVVEGYLLYDSLKYLEKQLPKIHRLFSITVSNKKYCLRGYNRKVTVKQIVTLVN